MQGVHLRLPGFGADGPTLEIYSYSVAESPILQAVNRPGFGHIAANPTLPPIETTS